jgi:hypothetical protein
LTSEGDALFLGLPVLGLPVRSSGVRLGSVSAVWVDADRVVVGLEVASAWEGTPQFLPAQAASVEDGAVIANALTFLTPSLASFYERNGAQRITLPASETRFRERTSRVGRGTRR